MKICDTAILPNIKYYDTVLFACFEYFIMA